KKRVSTPFSSDGSCQMDFTAKRLERLGQRQGIDDCAAAEQDAPGLHMPGEFQHLVHGRAAICDQVGVAAGCSEFITKTERRIRTGALVADAAAVLQGPRLARSIARLQRL